MSTTCPTDVLLWRVGLPRDAGAPEKLLLPGGLQAARIAWSRRDSLLYVYASLPRRALITPQARASLAALLAVDGAPAPDATLCRLELDLDLAGVNRGEAARYHYVVETDADPGWTDEIARWYRDEHLPGLASVPGCVHARRYINHDDARRSFACYDLIRADVLDSAQWLAVRATQWSSRTRPHFANTARIMFQNITEVLT